MNEEDILDDITEMLKIDADDMLAATASSGAQIRKALSTIDQDSLAKVKEWGKPRSVVITGVGGSGISGRIAQSLAHVASSIPVVAVGGFSLPTWVGPTDVVIALSCSGSTEETIAGATEAGRRGAQVIAITTPGSKLDSVLDQVRDSITFDIDAMGRMPRASMWTLLTPLLLIGDALGIFSIKPAQLESVADLIDAINRDCAVETQLDENPGKLLGLQFAQSLPMVWGTGAFGGVIAYRVTSQLAENAKLPAIHGEMPESQHNQIVVLDGPYAAGSLEDLFEDENTSGLGQFRIFILKDTASDAGAERRANVVNEIAAKRGVKVTFIESQGSDAISRMASLIALTDWASVYAALALGIDPTPIIPILELKDKSK
jgi:glucose/mannose-6-phosphate isomerase